MEELIFIIRIGLMVTGVAVWMVLVMFLATMGVVMVRQRVCRRKNQNLLKSNINQ